MEATVTNQELPSFNIQIPFDLFVSKKKKNGLAGGNLRFTDASGNLAFRVERQAQFDQEEEEKKKSTPSDHGDHHRHCTKKLLLDASGNILFSIHRVNDDTWEGFKGSGTSHNDLVFRVVRVTSALTRTEFGIFLDCEHSQDSKKADIKMRGCPFKRSCTIYRGDSILAETSLMYTLGIRKYFVPRSRFRVTIFPGFRDHSLIVAFIVIFFHGRKFWI